MPIALIAALIIVLVAVAFSLQNAVPITIQFFTWTFQGSLVVVLLMTLILGILIHLLASMPTRIKRTRQIAQLNKRIQELEHALTERIQPDTRK